MIAAVVPCYKVKKHILEVLSRIGPEVNRIYVIDDSCPEQSGKYVIESCSDTRVKVLFHEINKGVGGSVITGYKEAMADGAIIIIKLDGDEQMDPSFIPKLISPIQNGNADYCKGNRFFDLEKLLVMPKTRLIGNSILSLLNKMVNGYWNIVDPTNGYTAIHIKALEMLPLHKIDNRYFFESDMLFRLSTIRAVIKDIPIPAIYGQAVSNLKVWKILFEFPFKYLNRFFKRLFYNYILRDFNAGSIQLFFGLMFSLSGLVFGVFQWIKSYETMVERPIGTVMIAALLLILGFQMLLGALNFDVQNTPSTPLQKL